MTAVIAEPEQLASVTAIGVHGLRVDVERSGVNLVDGIEFTLRPGEIMGLVGESGSGKTTTALALLAYAKLGTLISSGSVRIDGEDILADEARAVRRKRGRAIAYVPQDPAASLNPTMRIGAQLRESARKVASGGEAMGERVSRALADVALPSDPEFQRRFPHQLSGGQQQRVALAMAFIARPAVVVLDEPTTGLDVTTQAHVLETVRGLCDRHGTAAIYVSHDLAVVASVADSVSVMYLGRLVETGPAARVLRTPTHPYTRLLVAAIPDPKIRRALRGIPGHMPSVFNREEGCVFASRCPLVIPECRTAQPPLMESSATGGRSACLRREHVAALPRVLADAEDVPSLPVAETPLLRVERLTVRYGSKTVIEGLDLSIPRGSCMSIVGESGSGKTTLAKTLGGLHAEAEGRVLLDGAELPFGSRARSAAQRRAAVYVFQNPYSSLNPRRTVRELLEQSLRAYAGTGAPEYRVAELLELVALNPRLADRYPGQLSGGERQRVAIARAVAADPALLICDEITSALDVSVQASIVSLLKDLHARSGTSILFITHNIAVVRALSDHVAVLRGGELVEQGPVARVLDHPSDPYTAELLSATPALPNETP